MVRYQESRGHFSEAAAAYAKAGDFLHAGDCFAKAKDMTRSAECFERAREFYRSGLAFDHAARFKDIIRVLQKLKEDNANFDASRALLGRCFYEEHDYAHCAAALDNHLMGKKVESGNMELFYMLALSMEQ